MPKKAESVRFVTVADREIFEDLRLELTLRRRGETVQSEIRRFLKDRLEELSREKVGAEAS